MFKETFPILAVEDKHTRFTSALLTIDHRNHIESISTLRSTLFIPLKLRIRLSYRLPYRLFVESKIWRVLIMCKFLMNYFRILCKIISK